MIRRALVPLVNVFIISVDLSTMDALGVDALVARQAIFDRKRHLYGYELLYRSNAASIGFDGTDDFEATLQVLSNLLLSIGSENLLGGKKAFINFDHRLLASNIHLSLPPESVVIEVLETVEPTADLIALCQGITREGYTLALDDFTDEHRFKPLAQIAAVIKVDMRTTSRQKQKQLLLRYKPRGVLMLAEKVETDTEFNWAWSAGYDLFQGYFFARPSVVHAKQIPAGIRACLELQREMQHPNLDFHRVACLIEEDVSLTYKLLRYANSALFHSHTAMRKISRALLHLGEDAIRRWASLATVSRLAQNKTPELITLSLVRAHFCEQLAAMVRIGDPEEAYLMGMFSLLDALIDQPIDEALHNLDLGETITAALLGTARGDETFRQFYQLTLSYELGNWDEVDLLAQKLGVAPSAVGNAYIVSTFKAGQLQSVGI